MKKLLFCLVLSSALVCVAQEPAAVVIDSDSDNDVELQVIEPATSTQETEQEIKEREKRLREHNDKVAFMKAENSLKRGYFVVTADNIQMGHSGYRCYDISPNTNFVLVQQDNCIIQVAFNTGNPGANGLGGITLKGKVSNNRMSTDKNGDVHFSYNVNGSNVSAFVQITLFHNSKRAVVNITPSLNGPDITIYGNLLPHRDKRLKF